MTCTGWEFAYWRAMAQLMTPEELAIARKLARRADDGDKQAMAELKAMARRVWEKTE